MEANSYNKMTQESLEEDTIRKWKNDIKSKHGDDLNFTKHNGGYGGFTTVARKNDTIVGSFGHKNSIGRILDKLPEETEYIDEKTLTPNEIAKREEIVKSLKKRQSDFVKRYGADRAKSVMYAVATKTAKAVTEENELTEDQLDEMGYGSARAADHEFSRFGTAVPQKKAKFILKNKATGRVLSVHSDAPSAVAARNKIGSFSTHAIIKEESLDEATDVRTDHSVGDTVWAKHPTEKYKTVTGVVTRVGRTTYELQHKDGSKAMYPHKEVSSNFEKLNPNPYKTKKQIQREHLELTGKLLSLDEIVLDERIEMPQGHKYSADPITKASNEGKGRKKPQMGTKTAAAAIVAAILNKNKE